MRRRFLNNIKSISGDNHSEYFTIEALEDGLTAKLSINACEYCVDNDGNWKSLTVNTNSISINKEQTLSFRGNLTPTSSNGIGTFTISKKCNIKGNIMSLLYGDDFEGQTDLSGKNYAFYRLFYNCETLVSANELVLPATTLANCCYSYMFDGCTSLIDAPALPATTLASNCYRYMFYNCRNLVNAPALPATTLSSYCYRYMFYNCRNLVNAPALPATTLSSYCYYSMFRGCTNLVDAPELPATTLTDYCYDTMFYGCSKLSNITILATDISASNCLNNWVSGVSSSGTFTKHKNMTSLPSGSSGIPEGWTVVDYQDSVNLIKFYIEDEEGIHEFSCEAGMTWLDFIESKYNPTQGIVRDFKIYISGNSYITAYHEYIGEDCIINKDYDGQYSCTTDQYIDDGFTYYIRM